ncbi:MAG: hypothetical protein ACOYVG_09875 [Bacteroidota bacterium]
MIATKKYPGFNRLNKIYIAGNITRGLLKNIVKIIDHESLTDDHKVILTSSSIINSLDSKTDVASYENLYIDYFSAIDPVALSGMINSFIKKMRNDQNILDFTLLTSYLYAFFMDYWCQIVELAYQTNDSKLIYIGSPANTEYKILKSIYDQRFPDKKVSEFKTSLSVYLLDLISRGLYQYTKKKEIKKDKFANHFTSKIEAAESKNESKKIVVIGILEERRFGRISFLQQKLAELGYKVVLFSCLAKTETLERLNDFPELYKRVIFDNSLVTKNEAEEILNKTRGEVIKTYEITAADSEIYNHTYKSVPMIAYAWNELYEVIMHRFLQASVNEKAITKYLDSNKISCFIGMDNSVATSVWIKECNKRNIPTIFHFYNGTQSPIVFQLLADSFNPTKWFLGGRSQMEKLAKCKSYNSQQLVLTGDIFNDMVVNCNKKHIREKIRSLAGIEESSKLIVIISSYIASDFSIEKKKNLFQSVYEAAGFTGHKVVIKAHPNEDILLLKQQMKEWGIEAFLFHYESIRDVFIAADIVCMYFSESAQQAMMVEIPVISLVPEEMLSNLDKHWNYYSSGAVEFVSLGSSPKNAIQKIANNSVYREQLLHRARIFCENNFGKCDGNNAKRFASAVDIIVKGVSSI